MSTLTLHCPPPPPPTKLDDSTMNFRQAILACEVEDILSNADEPLSALVALIDREQARAFNEGQLFGLDALAGGK